MTTRPPISNATDSPLPAGEGLGVRSLKAMAVSTEKTVEMMELTKKQIEVTMFAVGAAKLKQLLDYPIVPKENQ